MPIVSNQESLDYVSGGYPFMVTIMSGVDGDGLDLIEGGSPVYASLGEVSTSIMRATQVVTEILRDADDPAGGNLRATAVAVEKLILNNEQIYLTLVAKERMYRNPSPSIGDGSGKGKSWMVFDEVNHLDVRVSFGDPPTSAANSLAVLNGANMALWGDELLQFRDVTDLGGGLYRLSYLLRGRFGTEWAMRSHKVGDRFVLLDLNTTRRISMGESYIGVGNVYKAVTVGQTLGAVLPRGFANYARGLKPYAPCHVVGTRDGSNNLTLTWVRRTRYGGEWRDLTDAALGETSEAYEVDILNSSGGLVRTLEDIFTPTVVYSAANQTTDFGSPQSAISVIVYQLSPIVGRGYGTLITV